MYLRRSGQGVSKTLVFADLVSLAGAILTTLSEAGYLNDAKWAGPAILVIGVVTRTLRQTGPTPQSQPALELKRIDPPSDQPPLL